MKAWPYERINEEEIRLNYGGDIYTFSPSSGERVSADNDGSAVLDTSIFLDIDEENIYTD